MSFLLDTDVLSEFRKGDRADRAAVAWLRRRRSDDLYVSVLSLGELRRGVERVRRRGDTKGVRSLEGWLATVVDGYTGRIVNVDRSIADRWGRLGVPDPVPDIDGLIAATAIERNLTVATRNVRQFARTGARYTNPFDGT